MAAGAGWEKMVRAENVLPFSTFVDSLVFLLCFFPLSVVFVITSDPASSPDFDPDSLGTKSCGGGRRIVLLYHQTFANFITRLTQLYHQNCQTLSQINTTLSLGCSGLGTETVTLSPNTTK